MGVHTIAVSYIPNPDPEALDWLENFAARLHDRGPALGVGPPVIETFSGLVRDFHDRLSVVLLPVTRTSPAITAKTIARNAAVTAVKPLVKAIRNHPAVTAADLGQFGLPAPNGERRRTVPPPATAPLIAVVIATDGSHQLRFADSLSPASRRKPPDVQHLMLYVAVSNGVMTNPALATFKGLFGRNPITVEHQPSDNGKTATYFGRWCTRAGLPGPWSLPTSMTVAFVQRGGPV